MHGCQIAIAGIGAAAETHAVSIADIDGASLVAGSCRTEATGQAFGEEFGCEWYADTEAMLDAEKPDVLTVCTPSGAHREPTLAAAERGVDVLCEKPLERTTERIDEMIAAADAAGVRLGGIFQQRYNPVLRTLHDAARSGRFEDLAVANAYVPWWRDDTYYRGNWQGTRELDGGGALMNQSIHGVDAILWLVNAALTSDSELDSNSNETESEHRCPVDEVFAYTGTRAHSNDIIEVEDTAVASLRYRNGAVGQILGTTSMYPGSRKRLQIAGSGGTAEVLEDELITWQFRSERDEDDSIRERFDQTKTGGGAAEPMDINYANHRRNIEAFLDTRATGERYSLGAREARTAVAVIEAIYDSAARGEPVRMK